MFQQPHSFRELGSNLSSPQISYGWIVSVEVLVSLCPGVTVADGGDAAISKFETVISNTTPLSLVPPWMVVPYRSPFRVNQTSHWICPFRVREGTKHTERAGLLRAGEAGSR